MNFPPVFPETSTSLLKKHLTDGVYERLKTLKTSNQCSLSHIINSGIQNPDSAVGIYAGDEESYFVFKELFDPVIKDYHGIAERFEHHTDLDFSVDDLGNPDPEGKFIQSFRIRTGRNISGFPLPSMMSVKDRARTEKMTVDVLSSLKGELSGTYYPLSKMGLTFKKKLINDHILFKEGDRFLGAAGITKHWPDNSGIFINKKNNFFVWVNEEDQLRIIALDFSCNILETCSRLQYAVNQIEKRIHFIFSKKYGYITSCPTNIGTSIRASVHIKLPGLALHPEQLTATAKKLNLQVRGLHGEHSETDSDIFDISNLRRLGITEKECISDMCNGIAAIIDLEKQINSSF